MGKYHLNSRFTPCTCGIKRAISKLDHYGFRVEVLKVLVRLWGYILLIRLISIGFSICQLLTNIVLSSMTEIDYIT